MQSVILKGTQDGYKLFFRQSAGINDILVDLKRFLDKYKVQNSSTPQVIHFNILTGDRLLTEEDKNKVISIFKTYPNFQIDGFISNVITRSKAKIIRERNTVKTISRTIRNGQVIRLNGDVLFFGDIHEGGKLVTTGNVYILGNVYGIVHAGVPNSEDKLVIGNLHNAQQVRIGEQFDIVADKNISNTSRTVAYINDLHVLDYGDVKNLKQINPRFYNRIGGII
ncbi:cell division inhibitor [Philodulcilactobacillus myokoensis]|uniref:Probable septum site-determining protein MinC n=1 Tax=Philodulcilactobacillus myokoensis TaxID=2929573 RepID=A0A9W6B1A8_9LACO|nr:septum site-determining protein MinC [Philodulcilactobacillus myokoensis]GLB46665.1 cell division inhibitor [Philodulcilactobacillus myokoensis]